MFLEYLKQDLRQSLRLLVQNKGWTITAVLTLALGIGPLTALFSLIDRVYAPLPVANPEQLVFSRLNPFTVDDYRILRDGNSTLVDTIAFAAPRTYRPLDVLIDAKLAPAYVEYISGNYFPLFKVQPIRGRTILPEDDTPSSPPVVMISETYWRDTFGQSPDAIGRTLTIEKTIYTIIGIWPSYFINASDKLDRDRTGWHRTQIMIPLVHRSSPNLLFIAGRLKPNVTVEQADTNLVNLIRAQSPERRFPYRVFTARYSGFAEMIDELVGRSPLRNLSAMLIIIGIIGFFAIPLVLSCTNIATFLLSRAEDRRVEIALRLSMGATRGRLMRQLLTESIVLALLGGAAGLALTYWWTRLLANPPFSAYGDIPVNWHTFALVLLVSLPAGVACGLLPAKDALNNASHMMQTFGVHFTRSKSTRPSTLIAIQVGLSFVGLVCVGLMLRTLLNMTPNELGFSIDHVATFTVNPGASRAPYDPSRIETLYERIVHGVSTIPGVRSVSFSDEPVVTPRPGITPIYARVAGGQVEQRDSKSLGVDPRFFETMNIPLKLGRAFSTAAEAVINETLAQSLFPNVNPVGLRFGPDAAHADAYIVVGVAGDMKNAGATVLPTAYLHDKCCTTQPKTFEVLTAGDPLRMLPVIRGALFDIDPDLPVTEITTAQAELKENFIALNGPWQLVLNYYAGLATALVITGVFGLMSHTVARRTREIGIRMAIGAQPSTVLWAVIKESVEMVVPGIAIGLASSLALGRFLSSSLYGVAPYDPMTFAASIALVGVISFLAGYFPARRASHVDPVVALRHD